MNRATQNMEGYASLLQNHIGKENNILFRIADQVFSAEEQKELLVQFAGVEATADPEFNAEASVEKINYLAAIYLK